MRSWLPNMRVQRTRSSASRHRSPLTRYPLGATKPRFVICSTVVFSIACGVASAGCSYGKSVPLVVAGKRFPCREAQSLGKGITPSDTRSLLGEPLGITSEGDVEVWRYFDKERYGDHVSFLGVPVSQPHYFSSCEIVLRFRGGTLESITFSWEDIGDDGKSSGGPTTRKVT